jgi:Protein of unknown function (DUF4232)
MLATGGFPAGTKGRTMFTLRIRPAAAAAVTLIGLAAAAGCSSSGSSATPVPSTATTTVTATAPAGGGTTTAAPTTPSGGGGATACATSVLQVKQSAPNGYAGGVYVTLDFTNTSSSSCTLYGYPGVSLLSSSRAQIGLAAKRTTTTAPATVTLASGATAHAQLQIVDALNFSSSTCGPVKAALLQIFPPNQKAAVFLTNTSTTCSKSVQTLFISPVQSGA